MHKTNKLDEVIARAIRSYLRENKKQLYEQGPKPGQIQYINPEDAEDAEDAKKKADKILPPKKTDNTTKKDSWGRPTTDKAYGYNEKEKKFTEGPNKGKRWIDVYPDEASPKKEPEVSVESFKEYEFSFHPDGRYGLRKRMNGYQMRAKELYDCKSRHVFGIEMFGMDLEDLYLVLVTGSAVKQIIKKDGKTIGHAKYRGIDSKQEWDKVNAELKRLTGGRGITTYADSFVTRSDHDFWPGYFDQVGRLLGGDGLKNEMQKLDWNAGCEWDNKAGGKLSTDEYGYGKAWEKWKNFGPDKSKTKKKMSDEEAAEKFQQDAEEKAATSGNPPLWAGMLANLLLELGVIAFGGLLFKRFAGKYFAKQVNLRMLNNITQEEINRLHNWITTRYEMEIGSASAGQVKAEFERTNPGKTFNFYHEKIGEAEYAEWLKFYQNRNKLLFQRREALARDFKMVESGEMTMAEFISKLEEKRKISDVVKRRLLQYEKEVLRAPKYEKPKSQPKPKPKPKPKSTSYKQTKIGFQQGKSTNKGKKP